MFHLGRLLLLLGLLPCLWFAEARKTRLTWVNGIAHSLTDMEEGKQVIEKLFRGQSVEYCFNPSAMTHVDDIIGYYRDITQAGSQKYLGTITDEVNTLVSFLNEAVVKVGKHGRVIHIAHSQGALITSLAARQMSPVVLSQIEVLAFGGAAALRRTVQTPFARCMNYYSVNDPLLFVVPEAERALRSGYIATVDGIDEDEFCFLTPRLGDPVADHSLIGPTYSQALAWEAQRMDRVHHTLIGRSIRSVTVFVVALMQILSRQLHELLKMVIRRLIQAGIATIQMLQNASVATYDATRQYLVDPTVRFIAFVCSWIIHMLETLRNNGIVNWRVFGKKDVNSDEGESESFVPLSTVLEQVKEYTAY
jgi:hypothetical protein